jgi:hypothetical protein
MGLANDCGRQFNRRGRGRRAERKGSVGIGRSDGKGSDRRARIAAGNAQPEAESCYHQAIKIARQQNAKSWELRAAKSLARLWQRQGKTAAARRMLAEIYSWFTEGFGTADLKDAKALLEDLSPEFSV